MLLNNKLILAIMVLDREIHFLLIKCDPQWVISKCKWMWRHFLLSPSMQGSSTMSVWHRRFYEYNFFIYLWK